MQGNFREHVAVLRRLGAEPVEVRKAEQLDGLDGLVIPGGESTAIARLMRIYGLEEAIRRFTGPVFGTCAGMILLDRDHLGLVDVSVRRNAYGRQVASFEAELELAGEEEPLLDAFSRAGRQGLRHLAADVALPPDVGLEMNGLAGLRDRMLYGLARMPPIAVSHFLHDMTRENHTLPIHAQTLNELTHGARARHIQPVSRFIQ